MRIRFDDLKVYVAAVDGQPTDTFEPLRATLPFSPGSRYDLLLDMPEAGAKGAITALLGPGVPLVAARADRRARGGRPAADRALAAERAAAAGDPAAERRAPGRGRSPAARGAARTGSPSTPATRPGSGRSTAQAGRPGMPPLATVPRGSVVVLAIVNQTPAVQPLHLHGHVFRLLHPFDDGWEPYWLDTLQVPENRTVRIAFVADNPGRWALSSTVLERFDTGLWTWFEVT